LGSFFSLENQVGEEPIDVLRQPVFLRSLQMLASPVASSRCLRPQSLSEVVGS
jgi:hypothetical protein